MLLQETEFEKEIDTENLLIGPEGVLVVYDWVLGQEDINRSRSPSQSSILTHPSSLYCCTSESSGPPFQLPAVTHTVTFKCIGAVREEKQQVALHEACLKLKRNEHVEVKLQPEPTNCWDSKAIAFMCFVGDRWQRVGYVVREALDEVHFAMQHNQILRVKFAWVKFLLHWSRSGPGYYAGVDVSKNGNWSDTIVRAASTR